MVAAPTYSGAWPLIRPAYSDGRCAGGLRCISHPRCLRGVAASRFSLLTASNCLPLPIPASCLFLLQQRFVPTPALCTFLPATGAVAGAPDTPLVLVPGPAVPRQTGRGGLGPGPGLGDATGGAHCRRRPAAPDESPGTAALGWGPRTSAADTERHAASGELRAPVALLPRPCWAGRGRYGDGGICTGNGVCSRGRGRRPLGAAHRRRAGETTGSAAAGTPAGVARAGAPGGRGAGAAGGAGAGAGEAWSVTAATGWGWGWRRQG